MDRKTSSSHKPATHVDRLGMVAKRIAAGAALAGAALASTLALSAPAQALGTGPEAISTGSPCSVQGDLEGAFTASSQMPGYLKCVLPDVEAWIDYQYLDMPHPASYQFVPQGVSGTTPSGCAFDETSLAYCLGDQTVYLGESAVWKLYQGTGDAAPALVVAHEVTHHFQNYIGVGRATTANEQIRYENQADCGAGAFMAYARQQGLVDGNDDVRELATALVDVGESEGPHQSHGTVEQRVRSFYLAYSSSLRLPMAECIPFVPETPIIGAG
ncbi:neutral zinc metallopeptidase [Rhodococcus wratislaviensis]|uniref:Metalloprotease n=1 Tax=Rhodococcus wratislaviensis NBRC 100605 TaxID=1219028 RepID=X0QET6_RHOWR|nr:neutral zinc metallopeptidase [Rhodococcus wratislaviensis]GAF49411.1 hypothetical protein RW1_081_00080 [Rhodococcus wratislaviensis NBRC 100605]